MPTFEVQTAHQVYPCVVERGISSRVSSYLPAKAGRVFAVTTEDVWNLHRKSFASDWNVLFFPGGEVNKRLECVEALAEQMVAGGADRTSVVIGFGGGIVTDVAGFLAAVFMRGVPVLQVPTTLLAQVDAAVGGKTGVNLVRGKNLIGSFHQPNAVLIDPDVLATLPEREYRAGLFEVIKCGVIRDPKLFELLENNREQVLGMDAEQLEYLIAAAVRIKADVVSADEREGDLRRILNFGHTIGHAIEAETCYTQFLHGEAVAWGMLAATRLSELMHMLEQRSGDRIRRLVRSYGDLPSASHLDPDRLLARLGSDKKTIQGKVHFVLPTEIGAVRIVSGIDTTVIREAIVDSLQ